MILYRKNSRLILLPDRRLERTQTLGDRRAGQRCSLGMWQVILVVMAIFSAKIEAVLARLTSIKARVRAALTDSAA